jgi:hypothetical protein
MRVLRRILDWLTPRRPSPAIQFRELDERVWESICQWLRSMPPSRVEFSGQQARVQSWRGDPSVSGAWPDVEEWVKKEMQTVVAYGQCRVEENLSRQAGQATGDYEVGCFRDPERGVAQITLFLKPKDPKIGRILFTCEVAKTADEKFIAWGTGLRHDRVVKGRYVIPEE